MEQSGELASCDAATSRSSAKRVAGVVSKFCDIKRKLVCDIGFDGILHIPQINKTPRKLTVWLLSKVDFRSKSIIVNGRCKVEINDLAFQRVLGIPCGPKKLRGLETNELQDKMDFIKLAMGSVNTDPLETCCLKVAEDVLTMDYANGMSKEQADRFKVSFVVYVVGHFLVAKSRTNHGVDDYWGSLLCTEGIHLHNFCSLVIDEIMESAKKVQEELRCNRTIKNVTGCTLGLQILYLDSLNLPEFNLPPERFPRIALFDLTLLKKMIHSDQENNISYFPSGVSGNVSTIGSNDNQRVQFSENVACTVERQRNQGKNFIFSTPKPAVSSYLTAYLRGSIKQKLSNGQVDSLKWHNARMIYHVRKTKETLFEGVGFSSNADALRSIVEVHMEALMAKIFQDNLSLAQRLHNHGSKLCTPSEYIVKESNSLHASSDFNFNRSEGKSSVGGVSNEGSMKCNTVTSGSKRNESVLSPLVGKFLFQGDIKTSAKRRKQENELGTMENIKNNGDGKITSEPFLLSEVQIDAIIEHGCGKSLDKCTTTPMPSVVKKLRCRQKRIAPNPWMFGAPRKVVAKSVSNGLYVWLQENNLSTLKSNWIIHALPKYIELDGYGLKDIFINQHAFSGEAFDIAIRRIVQLDCFMYGPERKLCWRHVLESDFAMMVLANMDPLESVSIIYQLTMQFNNYDISECRMIVIPAVVNSTWCVYFWDMEETVVHVIDPFYHLCNDNSIGDMHIMSIKKIQDCLAKVISLLYEGWNVKWAAFRTNFVKPIITSPKSFSDGILTLLAIQEFDGSEFVVPQNEVTVEEFNKLVLYEMVSLEDNYGKPPSGFIQTIF